MAISNAMASMDEIKSAEVPLHLRDTHYKGATALGHEGYQYPHNFPGHYVKQEYLPKEISQRVFIKLLSKAMRLRFVIIKSFGGSSKQLATVIPSNFMLESQRF